MTSSRQQQTRVGDQSRVEIVQPPLSRTSSLACIALPPCDLVVCIFVLLCLSLPHKRVWGGAQKKNVVQIIFVAVGVPYVCV